jgi:DNA repair exonuclease SbcCD ATPase subunit
MKSKYPIITLAMIVLLAGCSGGDQSSREPKDAPVNAADVKERYREAASATKRYVAENKNEFISAMDAKLKELDGKIGELTKKSESLQGDAKTQAEKALASLGEQRQKAKDKLEELKQAGGDAWDQVKTSFKAALEDLEKACQNAKSKFE